MDEIQKTPSFNFSEPEADLVCDVLFGGLVEDLLKTDQISANETVLFCTAQILLKLSELQRLPGINVGTTPIPDFLSKLSLNFGLALKEIKDRRDAITNDDATSAQKFGDSDLEPEAINLILESIKNINVSIPDELL